MTETRPTPGLAHLSAAESARMLEQITAVTEAGIPLHLGLRAAADDVDNRRLARAMRTLAARLEQGESLESILSELQSSFPPHLNGLIQAAGRTGRMGFVLVQLTNMNVELRRLWNSVISAMSYPAVLLALTVGVFLFLMSFVVPVYDELFHSFQLELPITTQLLVNVSRTSRWMVLACVVVIASAVLLRLICGPSNWRSVMSTVPFVGAFWQWWGASEFARLLGLMIESDVPLVEALRLTGQGVQDGSIRRACPRLADRVSEGAPLSDAVAQCAALPWSLVPLLRWGERTGAVPEALRTAAEMMEGYMRFRAAVLRTILPPMLFILIVTLVGFIVPNMMLPMVGLIQGLAG